ncbi:hypothetical protein BCR44DRAFT_294564, partial [Catenaria anguillulae PL171]
TCALRNLKKKKKRVWGRNGTLTYNLTNGERGNTRMGMNSLRVKGRRKQSKDKRTRWWGKETSKQLLDARTESPHLGLGPCGSGDRDWATRNPRIVDVRGNGTFGRGFVGGRERGNVNRADERVVRGRRPSCCCQRLLLLLRQGRRQLFCLALCLRCRPLFRHPLRMLRTLGSLQSCHLCLLLFPCGLKHHRPPTHEQLHGFVAHMRGPPPVPRVVRQLRLGDPMPAAGSEPLGAAPHRVIFVVGGQGRVGGRVGRVVDAGSVGVGVGDGNENRDHVDGRGNGSQWGHDVLIIDAGIVLVDVVGVHSNGDGGGRGSRDGCHG